eukprot:6086148-Amphidinium_carterae.1
MSNVFPDYGLHRSQQARALCCLWNWHAHHRETCTGCPTHGRIQVDSRYERLECSSMSLPSEAPRLASISHNDNRANRAHCAQMSCILLQSYIETTSIKTSSHANMTEAFGKPQLKQAQPTRTWKRAASEM